MGMIGCFRLVEPRRLAALLEAPEAIADFLSEEEQLEAPSEDIADLDIDKAWHGIHFLLTGTEAEGSPPLNFLLQGGHPIGDEDVGYGPARGFTREEVRALVQALEPLTPEVLGGRFDPRRMTKLDIYPDIWNRQEEDADNREYLLDYYVRLKEFLKHGAERGFALIVYVT